MSTITVTATRWEHGWELEIGPDRHTQVVTLDKAAQQVRDYLDTESPDVNHDDWEIDLHVELGSLGDEVTAAREATAQAAAASRAAAQRTRRVVQRLRASGLSVTDSAAILGVSRGRISQLARPSTSIRRPESAGNPQDGRG